MGTTFRHLRTLAAALLVLMALLAAPAPAKAGLGDCFEAMTGDAFAQAAKQAMEAAGCVSQAAGGDAVMAATIAAMTALYAGGAFSDTSQCLGLIDGVVGKMLAEALLKSGAAKIFGSEAETKLTELAEGVGNQTLSDIVSSTQALQVLFQYATCGCKVAGAPGEAQKIADQYMQDVAGCGDFALEAAEAVLDGILSGAEAIGEGLLDVVEGLWDAGGDLLCAGTFGLVGCDDPPPCKAYVIPPEKFGTPQSTPILSGSPSACGKIYCAAGGHVVKTETPTGTTYKCAYCPNGYAMQNGQCQPCVAGLEQAISADKMCSLTKTTSVAADGSQCIRLEEQTSCCETGQKVSTWGHCKAACDPPQYFDTQVGACTRCDESWIPDYASDPAKSSIAQCKRCPGGLTSAVAEAICEPCPRGQIIWDFGQSTAGGAVKMKPGALDAKAKPITLPPASAPKDDVMQALPPGGGKSGAAPGKVAAQPGKIVMPVSDRCATCPENWTPVYHQDPGKSSFGHCEECPPGTYTTHDVVEMLPLGKLGELQPDPNPGRCRPLQCQYGIDPQHPHRCQQVLTPAPFVPPVTPGPSGVRAVPEEPPCPRGLRRPDGSCGPAASEREKGPPRLVCPPGRRPNAAHTACVPDLQVRPGTTVKVKPPQVTVPLKRPPPPPPRKPPAKGIPGKPAGFPLIK